MFVSNTETTISLSRETSLITNLIARSNSDKSPRITSVSSESIRVKEKLKKKTKISHNESKNISKNSCIYFSTDQKMLTISLVNCTNCIIHVKL